METQGSQRQNPLTGTFNRHAGNTDACSLSAFARLETRTVRFKAGNQGRILYDGISISSLSLRATFAGQGQDVPGTPTISRDKALDWKVTGLFRRRPVKMIVGAQLHPRQLNYLMCVSDKVARRVNDRMHVRYLKTLNYNLPPKLTGRQVLPLVFRFRDNCFQLIHQFAAGSPFVILKFRFSIPMVLGQCERQDSPLA